MNQVNYKPNTFKALGFLIVPLLLAAFAVILFRVQTRASFIAGTFVLSLFFTQTFFLLHEFGHLNFFPSKLANKILGNLAGILTGIPFFTWVHMHNLHHKWTGWRDLDPTTEKTVKPGGSMFERMVVNIAWFLFIPLFYLTYMFSNYWNVFKIKRFVPLAVFKNSVFSVLVYATLYFFLFLFYNTIMLYYILPAFIISLIWKELVIMTQHTHIEIPISEGKKVMPISYVDQVEYTRSFYTFPFISRYFLLNFNLHEAHHVYPGLPAYWLDKIDINVPKTPSYWTWFKKAKGMKGEDYVFRTSKHTGEKI